MPKNKSFKFWIDASRKASLGQSMTPYILGVLLATSSSLQNENLEVNWLLALAGLVGVAFAHMGINLLDDYFDYKKGAVAQRQALLDGGMRARTHKCSYIDSGEATLRDTLLVASFFLSVALAVGVVEFVFRGPLVLLFAAIGLIFGVLYAGPPLRLSYRGFGELVVGFIFGPLVVIPAYFVTAGQIDLIAIWASIPVGLLATNIVNAHAIMDFQSDKNADRTTLVVLIGSKRAGLYVSIALIVLSYLVLVLGVSTKAFPFVSLVALITLPMVYGFVKLLKQYVDDSSTSAIRKWWMGPMGNWDTVQAVGIDWFMIRWYLSRNILMGFVLLLGITSFFR